jgi:cell wall-associated NlpC family hydrolase
LEEEDDDQLSPELLTPPDATAGGVAAVDGAVNEAIDGGAPPRANFATTTAGVNPTARAGTNTVPGSPFATTTAGVNPTARAGTNTVPGATFTTVAAGIDATVNGDAISTAAGVD